MAKRPQTQVSKSDSAGVTATPNPMNIGMPVPRPLASEVTPPSPTSPELKPQPEKTARQDSIYGSMAGLPGVSGVPGLMGLVPGAFYGSSGWGGGLGAGMGGLAPFYSGFGSIGVNGYGIPYGSFSNYYIMERNPTVALAEAVADAPIRSAEITYGCRDGCPQEWLDFVRGNFAPHEKSLLDIFSYARGWGFRPAEIIYKYGQISGKLEFDRAKALMPELTIALQDEHGNLVGLENQGTKITDSRRYMWLTYDGKGCNVYGRSRKENCKKPWLREEALYDLMEYSMNIMVRPFGYVTYPYGLTDANGASQNDQMQKNAAQIAAQMSSGQWAVVPNPFAQWMEEMVQKGINPKDVMPYDINWYDQRGDSGEAFERMFKITSRGIVMGILQPPRTILEGPGSQADASQHTDTAMLIPQQFLDKICRKVSTGPIDTVLVQNFGEQARGAVWWQAAPLVNRQLVFNNDLVRQILGQPDIGPTLMKHVVNLASIFETAGVKIDEFDQKTIVAEIDKAQEEKQQQMMDAAEAGRAATQPNAQPGKKNASGRRADKDTKKATDKYKKKGKDARMSMEIISTEPLSKEEEDRRKAFLLALLAYFAWQQEQLVTHPLLVANSTAFNMELARVLTAGMVAVADASEASAEIRDQAQRVAVQVNGATAKNIESGGKYAPKHPSAVRDVEREAMIRRVMGKSIELRASMIEDDMSFLAGEILKAVQAKKAGFKLAWRTAKDDLVCAICGPLDGVTVNAGEEFAPGIRYPVVDTHGNCRCTAEVVGVQT